MKNVLGKLRKILPALLFFISCGVFIVHAINNDFFYNKYSINESDNTLTDSDWNNLMGDLDNLVPDGTVLAFLSDKCPTGWNDFTIANDGRFLMGADSDIGNRGGKSSITLSVSQIPAHSHYIRFGVDYIGDNANVRPVIVDWEHGYHLDIQRQGENQRKPVIKTSGSPNQSPWIDTVKTESEGSNSPINILNPHIRVHYCIKGEYIPTTYTVTINKGNGGMVNQSSIVEYSGASITSHTNKITIGGKAVIATANNGYSFNGRNNYCGPILEKNCSITATRKQTSGGGGGCFLKGTKVLMKDGYKNIEDVKLGDIVLSYNEKTHLNEYSKVIETFIHENNNNDLYQLTINNDILKVTNIHPFYVKREGNKGHQWIEAQNLKVGDKLLLYNGTYKIVEKIIHYPYQGNVYNIEVERFHNYYVDKGYLVHNKRYPNGQRIDDKD